MEKLKWFTEQVESRRIHLCDSYDLFFRVCASIAGAFGMEGKEYARRICMMSDNYTERGFEYQYNYCVRRANGRIHIGTLYYMGVQAGLDIKDMYDANTWNRMKKEYEGMKGMAKAAAEDYESFKSFKVSSPENSTHAYDNENPSDDQKNSRKNDELDDDFSVETAPVNLALPSLVSDWTYPIPTILRKIVDVFSTEAEKCASLISSISLLSYFISKITSFIYGDSKYHPTLYFMVVGSPASNKGCVAKTFALLDAINERRNKEYEEAMKVYEEEMRELSSLGKEKANRKMPKKPVLRAPRIAVDSSGSATIQSISECGGHAVLLSTEMSEMTAALSSDFGGKQNSAVMRLSYDHETLMMRRRKNDEFINIMKTILSITLTGTDEQFSDYMQSAENGQFSRGVYFIMPTTTDFVSQWKASLDAKKYFRTLGEQYEKTVSERISETDQIQMELTDEQKNYMDRIHTRLNIIAKTISLDMIPYVRRSVVNVTRIMTGFAFIRAMEDWGTERCLLTPTMVEKESENGPVMGEGWSLRISDADFHWVLNMAEPLFEHASHAYSLLERRVVKSNFLREFSAIIRKLPNPFTTKEYQAEGQLQGYNISTLKTWLRRSLETGVLEHAQRGLYYIKQ